MNIGQAAATSGVSAKMIRYYEEIGLIPPAARTASGYRSYGEREINILRFVRRARDLGFSVPAIRDLLALWQDQGRASGDVKALALAHVGELTRKIAEMREMVRTLEHLAEACHGDDRPDCPILEELGRSRG